MCLGRTCRTTDAVTTGTAAKQNDNISRIGGQSLHRTSRSRTEHCTDLHALRHIIRMVYLLDITGCQTDLVTIRTVTVCRLAHQLLLRKLARDRVFHRNRRICRTGHTHCLIDIGTSGKRVTDRTAQTGCSTTERLNLCRVVMCLVLKVYKPLLGHAVHLDRNDNRAGIDLIGFLLIHQLAFLFEALHRH